MKKVIVLLIKIIILGQSKLFTFECVQDCIEWNQQKNSVIAGKVQSFPPQFKILSTFQRMKFKLLSLSFIFLQPLFSLDILCHSSPGPHHPTQKQQKANSSSFVTGNVNKAGKSILYCSGSQNHRFSSQINSAEPKAITC